MVSNQYLKEIRWSFNGLCNSSVKKYHLYQVIRYDLHQHWTTGSHKFHTASRFFCTAFTMLNTHFCFCADMEWHGMAIVVLAQVKLACTLPFSFRKSRWTFCTSSLLLQCPTKGHHLSRILPQYHHIPR